MKVFDFLYSLLVWNRRLGLSFSSCVSFIHGTFSPACSTRLCFIRSGLEVSYLVYAINKALDFYESRPGLVFVIGKCFKQGLLRPIHNWAMTLLKALPTDGNGTFHQSYPPIITYAAFFLSFLGSQQRIGGLCHTWKSSIFGPTRASCIVFGLEGTLCREDLSLSKEDLLRSWATIGLLW